MTYLNVLIYLSINLIFNLVFDLSGENQQHILQPDIGPISWIDCS